MATTADPHATPAPGGHDDHGDGHGQGDGHGHGHHKDLGHHWDSLEQQFDAAKLGMWLFLVTEILFFSGLFVAYAVYRTFRPDIFEWGHAQLNVTAGLINTIVLLFSSMTMAWAVRCAQLEKRTGLIVFLSITIACAFIFCIVKTVEYSEKFAHGDLPEGFFVYDRSHHGEGGDHGHAEPGHADASHAEAGHADASHAEAGHADASHAEPGHVEAGHDHAEEVVAMPSTAVVAPRPEFSSGKHHVDKNSPPPPRAGIFFSIYFTMTGLHAFHVLVGIGVLSWILMRSIRGDFSAQYYTPIDLGGLYWHLVDLIWIFLFPLLYLID